MCKSHGASLSCIAMPSHVWPIPYALLCCLWSARAVLLTTTLSYAGFDILHVCSTPLCRKFAGFVSHAALFTILLCPLWSLWRRCPPYLSFCLSHVAMSALSLPWPLSRGVAPQTSQAFPVSPMAMLVTPLWAFFYLFCLVLPLYPLCILSHIVTLSFFGGKTTLDIWLLCNAGCSGHSPTSYWLTT